MHLTCLYQDKSQRSKVKIARKFLKFGGAKISAEDFNDNVSLPKPQRPEFIGLEKAQVVELLNACKNQRLKTALMMFAVTGCRGVQT